VQAAGLTPQAETWLRLRLDKEPGKQIRLGNFGERSFEDIILLRETLRQGDAAEIKRAVPALVGWQRDSEAVGHGFSEIVVPLTILGRGSLLPALDDRSLEWLGGSFTENAARYLGAVGDWDSAFQLLDQAHRDRESPYVHQSTQALLWKYAYLQGRVETVVPRLANIPFDREHPHMAGERAWQLLTYQVRAGLDGVRVPVLTSERQTPGYVEAAAMQIAALEGVSPSAEVLAELERVFSPKPVTMHFVDRGVSFQLNSSLDKLLTARVCIAARRKDRAKLSALASMTCRSSQPASDIVIDSLIEEGDWRGAAEFADLYDPRDQPVIEGFDDTRMENYCQLHLILAAAAARDGADTVARAHLSMYADARASMRQTDRPDDDEVMEVSDNAMPPGLWPATLLAGAAQGRIPRHLLAMMLPVFRTNFY
jgi:hypothetical protein